MGSILSLINRALLTATPALLKAAATKIATLTRTVVQPTAASIYNAIKTWVGNNPSKAMLAANILASAGISIAVDSLESAMQDDGITDEKSLAVYRDMVERLAKQRSAHTGDGKATSVNGIDGVEYEETLTRYGVVRDIIRDGVRHAGSLNALEAIRKAVFLEDADFRAFRNHG